VANLNPPPVSSPFDANAPKPSPEWIRWINQLYNLLAGGELVASVSYEDNAQLDAFQRLRVSIGNTLFDTQQEYGLDTRESWDAVANGNYAALSFNGSVYNAG